MQLFDSYIILCRIVGARTQSRCLASVLRGSFSIVASTEDERGKWIAREHCETGELQVVFEKCT
jgi:hypothetical protein